jgi:acetylornithine/LysW-gamma-L-lysine aminotransferase
MGNTIETENRYTSGVYAKREINIVRGQGALLYDDAGNEYIDCAGGQGVANLGHAHPAVAEAIAEQTRTLITCPEMFYNPNRAMLLERLVGLAPASIKRAFLCNSGTEAVEAALKFARASSGRQEIVAAMRGFHGRTFGALSATWNKKYRAPFEPLVPGFRHVPYNNLAKLEQVVSDKTAAVILEVVQGESGVILGETEFLRGAQEVCRRNGALLVIDEVQTGFGRTGKMFALEHHGLEPDLICLAKSIAGGVPMGAVLIGERVGELETGSHSSTFGGNPLACAAALATLNALENERLVNRAAELGEYLLRQLVRVDSPLIREVRGLGLMIGIETRQKVTPYLKEMMERGVLALPAGLSVIRLLPPLVIRRAQIDQVVEIITEVLTE